MGWWYPGSKVNSCIQKEGKSPAKGVGKEVASLSSYIFGKFLVRQFGWFVMHQGVWVSLSGLVGPVLVSNPKTCVFATLSFSSLGIVKLG